MSQHTSSSTGRVCTEYTRELPRGFVLLLFYIRAARRKAISVATMEALSLLQGLGAVAMIGGPLSEVGGIFWVAMPGGSVVACIERLPRLGYPSAVDLAQPADEPPNWVTDKAESVRIVRWKRKSYRLLRLYEEDCDLMRESAPDRRVFLLETADSTLRDIRGYRGNSSPLGRRGLPVCDARMLVNVVLPPNGVGTSKLFLDPFAGAGGVVLEAQAHRFQVVSSDVDPTLAQGLRSMGSKHVVADSRALPFEASSFDAIATEPPYFEGATPVVTAGLREMCRVMKEDASCSMLCAAAQAEQLRDLGTALRLSIYLDAPINRKGLDVTLLAWRKG